VPRLAVFVLTCLTLLAHGRAVAHSEYVSSFPPPGAGLASPPLSVSVVFSDGIQPEVSWIHVFRSDGAMVDLNDSTVIGEANNGLAVSLLPGLGPGIYRVVWQNLSEDGDGLTGGFVFGVGLAPPEGSVVMYDEHQVDDDQGKDHNNQGDDHDDDHEHEDHDEDDD